MVDTVLQFEAIVITYRILRSLKNRFGSTAEIGTEMLGSGLREVSNPSEILISQRRRIIWHLIAHLKACDP
jgi:DNA repair protein RadA/Sms